MSVQNKRSTMTLYTSDFDPFCHQIKIVLAEKDITADLINIDEGNKIEELYELNPYGNVPTLMTKDLIVYESSVIFEYLEERFPYPPLLSVFPLERARVRMLSKKINAELMSILKKLMKGSNKIDRQTDKVELLKGMFGLIPILKHQPYLMGEEFTIIDCSMAVILFQLSRMGASLSPDKAMPLIQYAKRLFSRESFRKSIKHL